jgi:hypothetical protein
LNLFCVFIFGDWVSYNFSRVLLVFFKSALQLFIEVHIFVHDFSIQRNLDKEQGVRCVPTKIYTHFASYYSSLETN